MIQTDVLLEKCQQVLRESQQARFDLTEAILNLPAMQDKERRQLIVRSLERPIPDRINCASDPQTDVLNIVMECIEHPNGLSSLFNSIHFLYKNAIAYQDLQRFLEIIDPVW